MTMDRKALIAIALSLLFLFFYRPILKWVGLDHYLAPPQSPQPTAVDTTRQQAPTEAPPNAASEPVAQGSATIVPTPRPASPATGPMAAIPAAEERHIEVDTPLFVAHFSSLGARLLSVELKSFAEGNGADGNAHPIPPGRDVPDEARVDLVGEPLFAVDLGSADRLASLAEVSYAVSESLDAAGAIRMLRFTAQDSAGTTMRHTYRLRPDDYGFDLEVEMRGIPFEAGITDYSLTTRSWPLVTEADYKADERVLRASSLVGSSVHREGVDGLLKGAKEFEGNVVWAGVQNRYFLAAVALLDGDGRGAMATAERRTLPADALARLPEATSAEQKVAINSMVVGIPAGADIQHRFYLYVGPAEYSRLADLGVHLEGAVDLGWSWLLPFSRALLRVMNWLFGFIGNYGWAIVVLATLVRVVLHPLNMMSMKSMRGMQKIQPEVERVRQKYKNDPQALNTAVMALYKEHKVNPAGGCLPMLLQMPLFIALYQVLFNAIELRQAPFISWMNDLSAPDLLFSVGSFPIRLLPVLMSASGFLTQKLTPTDPRQMTTMYMMNVVMLVFFYNLPSGLVLYWTVMNFLTAFQQWLVLRQDDSAPAAVPVPAPAPAAGSKKRRAVSR